MYPSLRFGIKNQTTGASTGIAFFFGRRFACNIFFRRRRVFGVTSTISSSATNSIACSSVKALNGTSLMASSAVETPERVGGGGAVPVGDQRSGHAMRDLAQPFCVSVE